MSAPPATADQQPETTRRRRALASVHVRLRFELERQAESRRARYEMLHLPPVVRVRRWLKV